VIELFPPFGSSGDGTSKLSRRRAGRPWFYANRDPQWEAPLDPDRDPIDKDGFSPHERRLWLRWLTG
jgi:hypothetical protein